VKSFLLFLKSLKEKIIRLIKFSADEDQSALAFKNPLLSKKADQQLVAKLGPKNLPSLNQLKTLPNFLSLKEKNYLKFFSSVITLCLILLIGNFYFSHSSLMPKEGGSYTEGLVGTPQYINPILSSYNDVDRDLSSLIFNGLLKINGEGVLVPDLAEEYQISPDRLVYTFKLKENILWHDNQPLTANDVIFTVTSIQDPEWQSQLKSALDNVQVEKLNDYSLRFILKEPVAGFINSLTFGILPEHLWLTIPSGNATLAELNKKPVGTGPYQFKSFTKDKNGNIRTIALKRNEKYYDQKPFIKELNFKFYGDFETATEALVNNNIEGLSLLPKEYQDKVAKNGNIKFYSLSLPQYTAIFFNTKKNEILKNKTVRTALAYAIDRQKILNESLDQKGAIINGPILPGFIGFYGDVKKYSFEPDKAKQLLKDAGWKAGEDGFLTKGGQPLQITLTTVEKVEYVKATELIKKNWEDIGVNVIMEIVSKERIRPDIIEPRNYDSLLFGQIIKSDPYPFWHSSQMENPGANLSVWADRNVDKLLEEARVLEDTEAINQKYIEFQSILAENVPAIFLYNPVHIYPVHEKIKGISTRRISAPADRFASITGWYIKTKRKFSWK
jgi:peptide/nickel transport system substrate-binding protein